MHDRCHWLKTVAVLATLAVGSSFAATDTPLPGDDATYRPTVMVRKGSALGTGTVIASVEGETLVLTASHVVEDPGPLSIDLFRYNLGLEKTKTARGFPRKVEATVVARDAASDLAILRIKGQLAFPYVARIARGAAPPAPGTAVVSIGFDRGERLLGFSTKVRSIERIDMEKGGGERPYLVTENPPEHGRSGGGLFRHDGALVGVCVARAEIVKGRKVGLFSSLANVRALLKEHAGLAESVAMAEAHLTRTGR